MKDKPISMIMCLKDADYLWSCFRSDGADVYRNEEGQTLLCMHSCLSGDIPIELQEALDDAGYGNSYRSFIVKSESRGI